MAAQGAQQLPAPRYPTASPCCHQLPLASVLPSGLQATELTCAGVAAQGAQQLPAPAIPQLHRVVPTAAGQRLAVRTPRHRVNSRMAWPLSVRSSCPLPLSHNFTVLSHCRWPASCHPDSTPPTNIASMAAEVRSSCPLPASHSFTVWSTLPLASVLPSGLQATDETERPHGR
jgi:hypothetical protein